MAKKMDPKQSSEARANLYDICTRSLANAGFETEKITGCALIHLPDGQFAKLKVSVCDAEKFDRELAREDYKEKQAKKEELRKKKEAERAEREAKKAQEE